MFEVCVKWSNQACLFFTELAELDLAQTWNLEKEKQLNAAASAPAAAIAALRLFTTAASFTVQHLIIMAPVAMKIPLLFNANWHNNGWKLKKGEEIDDMSPSMTIQGFIFIVWFLLFINQLTSIWLIDERSMSLTYVRFICPED